MKHTSFSIIVFLLFCSTIPSCTSSLLKLYGMKKIKAVDGKDILQYSQEYGIPLDDSYELDIAYASFLLSHDKTLYKEEIKNHYQPLQALYYDREGKLKSFQINCNAGGSPNLAWDRDSILTTFPPREQTKIDSLLSLDTQLKFLRTLTKISKFNVADYDFIVIIYWNRFMDRQSKRLIHFIQTNAKLSKEKKVKIIYANNDNIFALGDNLK